MKLLLVLILSLSVFAQTQEAPKAKAPDGVALVIIDMQPLMEIQSNYQDNPGNKDKIKELIENQVQAIKVAKQQNLPILVAEYDLSVAEEEQKTTIEAYLNNLNPDFNFTKEEVETTWSEITTTLEGYDKVQFVRKTKNSLFSLENKNVDAAKDWLEMQGVKNLVIMGVNGNACISSSILDALDNDWFNIVVYTPGTADLNQKEFEHPFKFDEHYIDNAVFEATFFTDPEIACTFSQIESIEELVTSLDGTKQQSPAPEVNNSEIPKQFKAPVLGAPIPTPIAPNTESE